MIFSIILSAVEFGVINAQGVCLCNVYMKINSNFTNKYFIG